MALEGCLVGRAILDVLKSRRLRYRATRWVWVLPRASILHAVEDDGDASFHLLRT